MASAGRSRPGPGRDHAIWLSIDRRPAEWDHANHLKRALDCYYRILSEPGHDRLKEILDASVFYPPIAPCAAGLLYFRFPVVPLTAQAVMLAFLAVGVASTFALGRRLLDEPAGLLAAFFVGTAPFVVFSLTNFQLDLPLMAVVALALYALVRTEEFSRALWAAGFGLVLGLGMLTKPPFGVYLLPPLLWTGWRALAAADRRRLGLLLLALLIGGALALPWYGPRLLGLSMQIFARSFAQAAEAGQAEALTAEGLLYYPRVFQPPVGMLVGPLFLWGLVALRKVRGTRGFLWFAALGPLVIFSLIQNKDLRYTLPVLPAIALVAAVGVRSLRPLARRALCRAVRDRGSPAGLDDRLRGALHQVVAEHLGTFLGAVAEAGDGSSLPQFVEREFREFLTCGVFEGGANFDPRAAPASTWRRSPAKGSDGVRAVAAGG